MAKPKRPGIVKDVHLRFLDNLRESGVTNMWGASSYVRSAFSLSEKDSKTILLYWIETFVKEVVPADETLTRTKEKE